MDGRQGYPVAGWLCGIISLHAKLITRDSVKDPEHGTADYYVLYIA